MYITVTLFFGLKCKSEGVTRWMVFKVTCIDYVTDAVIHHECDLMPSSKQISCISGQGKHLSGTEWTLQQVMF